MFNFPLILLPVYTSLIFHKIIYWTNSMSGQGEPNLALWLATEAGFVQQGKFIMFQCFIPYSISFVDQAHSFFVCLRTTSLSQSINTQKKNLANIQPSWPHTWSITWVYIYIFWCLLKKSSLEVQSITIIVIYLMWLNFYQSWKIPYPGYLAHPSIRPSC